LPQGSRAVAAAIARGCRRDRAGQAQGWGWLGASLAGVGRGRARCTRGLGAGSARDDGGLARGRGAIAAWMPHRWRTIGQGFRDCSRSLPQASPPPPPPPPPPSPLAALRSAVRCLRTFFFFTPPWRAGILTQRAGRRTENRMEWRGRRLEMLGGRARNCDGEMKMVGMDGRCGAWETGGDCRRAADLYVLIYI
jgi:hypothetical protein